ncbi:hypothetical protein KSF78_0008489 [Schistosoma japonicum]|nr:hypothetical protein KSF78_0008489 [Schistosoma japonicum]
MNDAITNVTKRLTELQVINDHFVMVMKNISDSKNQLTDATCLKEKTEAKYKGQFYTYIDYLLNEIQRDYPMHYLMCIKVQFDFKPVSSKYHYVDMSHYLDSRFLQKCLNHS